MAKLKRLTSIITATAMVFADVPIVGMFNTFAADEESPVDEVYYYDGLEYTLTDDIGLGESRKVSFDDENGPVLVPFSPESDGDYVIEDITTDYLDSYVTLFTIEDGSLNYLADNDDGGKYNRFKLSYSLEGGKTYYYGVRPLSIGNTGDIVFKVSEKTDVLSGNLHLGFESSVSISGIDGISEEDEVSYEWSVDGANIVSEANSSEIFISPYSYSVYVYCYVYVNGEYYGSYNKSFDATQPDDFQVIHSDTNYTTYINKKNLIARYAAINPETNESYPVEYYYKDNNDEWVKITDKNLLEEYSTDDATDTESGNNMSEYVCKGVKLYESPTTIKSTNYYKVVILTDKGNYVQEFSTESSSDLKVNEITYTNSESGESFTNLYDGASRTIYVDYEKKVTNVTLNASASNNVTYKWKKYNNGSYELMGLNSTNTKELGKGGYCITVEDGFISYDIYLNVTYDYEIEVENTSIEFTVAADEKTFIMDASEYFSSPYDLNYTYEWKGYVINYVDRWGGNVDYQSVIIDNNTDAQYTAKREDTVSYYICTVTVEDDETIYLYFYPEVEGLLECKPNTKYVKPGEKLSVVATTDSNMPITYEWYNSSSYSNTYKIDGENKSELVAGDSEYASYICIVKCGNVFEKVVFGSHEDYLYSIYSYSSYVYPAFAPGEKAVLEADIANKYDMPLKYQWSVYGVNDETGYNEYKDIKDATSATYEFSVDKDMVRRYRCHIIAENGSEINIYYSINILGGSSFTQNMGYAVPGYDMIINTDVIDPSFVEYKWTKHEYNKKKDSYEEIALEEIIGNTYNVPVDTAERDYFTCEVKYLGETYSFTFDEFYYLERNHEYWKEGCTYVELDGVDATCTEAGVTSGIECIYCHKVAYGREVIEALGHKEVVDEAVAATCTETGLTEGKHCEVCGEVIVAQEEVKATGHKLVEDKAVEATCSSTGLTEGKHCEVCDFVETEQKETEKLAHKIVEVPAIAATCTGNGFSAFSYCSVCNTVIKTLEIVPATGHKEVVDKAVAATTTATGLTEGKHCEVCGEVLVAQEVVPMISQNPFKDVKNGKYYTDAIVYLNSKGVMTGLNTTTFGFNSLLKREDMVTLLWKNEGKPNMNVKANVFNDIKPGKYYTDAVAWAKKNNIVGGYTSGAKAGSFGKGDTITRQDFVKIIYGYAQYKGYNTKVKSATSYTEKSDASKVSKYARESMNWAYENKLIGNGSPLDPKSNIKRQDAAVIIARFLQAFEK